jgi:hypothetical protein
LLPIVIAAINNEAAAAADQLVHTVAEC